MTAVADTPRERAEEAILACFEEGWEPTPREIAESLVDDDVADGLYEGCTPELEGWFSEYEQVAARLLGGGDR